MSSQFIGAVLGSHDSASSNLLEVENKQAGEEGGAVSLTLQEALLWVVGCSRQVWAGMGPIVLLEAR